MSSDSNGDAKRPPATTNDSGVPAASDEYSLTAGPTVLHDHYVVQKMQHFNRERVPERVVHAKGTGVHGARVAAGLGKATSENGAAAQAAEVVAARANRA